MYPFIRLAYQVYRAKRAPEIAFDDVYVSYHRIFPTDIDIFNELNNGRILTLFDMGRLPFGYKVGLFAAMKRNNWGLTMAGASVRYRSRVRMFEKVKITSAAVGRDEKFLYLLQTMWRGDEATSNILYRSAITNKNGIVPTQKVAEELGDPNWNPELPIWVKEWIAAEAHRDWPPKK